MIRLSLKLPTFSWQEFCALNKLCDEQQFSMWCFPCHCYLQARKRFTYWIGVCHTKAHHRCQKKVGDHSSALLYYLGHWLLGLYHLVWFVGVRKLSQVHLADYQDCHPKYFCQYFCLPCWPNDKFCTQSPWTMTCPQHSTEGSVNLGACAASSMLLIQFCLPNILQHRLAELTQSLWSLDMLSQADPRQACPPDKVANQQCLVAVNGGNQPCRTSAQVIDPLFNSGQNSFD